MLLLRRADVERLLDLDALVDALALAMAHLSAGRGSVPARTAAVVAERDAFMAAMPCYSAAPEALAAKLVTVFPRNAGGPLPTHQAVIVAFDAATGAPQALMDGTYVTAMRTAAGSALATRLLARPDAAVLAIVGTGVQARAHARMIPRVRPVREIRIAGRRADAARSLAAELRGELGLPAVAAESCGEALRDADIVCETTHADVAVVRGEWLAPGAHLNSVGYNPAGRQLDDAAVLMARVYVESRAAALAPFPSGANDLREPMEAGLIGAGHVVAELGEVLAGTAPGRATSGEITLYKSVGVAVQDAAAASLVLDAARRAGAGVAVEM